MTVLSNGHSAKAQTRPSILVTGGAGFIGSHLVDRLLAEDYWRVIVIDNFDTFYSPEVKRANVSEHLLNLNFTLHEIDIRDLAGLQAIFSHYCFKAVVHLAAKAGVRPSLESPADYFDTNVTGTLNLLDCAKAFGVRHFVFGSSSSVYGLNAKVPFSEGDKTAQPMSPYAASKTAAELLCHTYAHLYGIRCVCLRFFTVYGPRQRPDLAIHKFTRLIYNGQPIPVFGDGTTRRDYTYVDDIIQGVRSAIDYTQNDFEIFNLGESQTIQLCELIALIETNLGKSAILDQRSAQAGDMMATFADIAKAKLLLGYKPHTKIHNGIPKFTKWFLGENNK